MFGRDHLFRASWTLIDQAVVSLGTFAVNIILARSLVPEEYGTFALIFSVLMLLQIINNTLVIYPLTIERARAGDNRLNTIWSSLMLMSGLSLPLASVVALALVVLGRIDLLPVTVWWFLACQVQETARRVLFAELHHRRAIVGDSVSYLGQAVMVLLLALGGTLTLERVMLALAATSTAAAAIQLVQLKLGWSRPLDLVTTARHFWQIGRWSLATSLTTALRLQGMLWLVALLVARSETAQFQSALNIVSLVNPILFAMCNIIPQTAARALPLGPRFAWNGMMPYAVLGFVPTAGYFLLVMAAPQAALAAFYGSQSYYLDVGLGVQLLALAYLVNYGAEMASAFLHGVNAARTALRITNFGNAAAALLAVPLVLWLGWTGACITLLFSNIVRVVASYLVLKAFMAPDATEGVVRSADTVAMGP